MQSAIYNFAFPFRLVFLFILLAHSLGQVGGAYAQTFTSTQNGNWHDQTSWNRTGNCSANNNPSVGYPPVEKSWGCGVSVAIEHHISVEGHINNFGAGVFSGVDIAASGRLTFKNDLTINGGGSVPYIRLQPGAELHVEGTMIIDRPVRITIPSGSKLVVNHLVIGHNQPVITIEPGGELIVSGTTTLRSQATLNMHGKFVTDVLTFTSGGTINADAVTSMMEVTGDLTVTNGTLNLGNKAKLTVGGTTDVGQSGTIHMRTSSTAYLGKQVKIPNGATFRVENSAIFTMKEGLDMNGGGRLIMSNNTFGTIVGNVVLPNGEIQTNNFAELNIGGKLTASNGGTVRTSNNSSVSICDYPNSTQLGTYHIVRQANSFYGEGCIALPVVWQHFEAVFHSEHRVAKVNWTTATEKYSSHFVVERMVSQLKGFEEMGVVQAIGWSDLPTSYQLDDVDLTNITGMVYYRVKQVDFDGKFTYTDVTSITVTATSAGKATVVAYPNPTNGDRFDLKISGHNTSGGTFKARIISWNASNVMEAQDLASLSAMLATEIKRVPKGLCVIELIVDNQPQYIKVMKQ